MSDSPSPLDRAPDDVKLAVDLIYLLESNEVDPHTALSALEMVKRDLQTKMTAKATTDTP
ncbi:pleiotropic regulatory protein RsmS [Vibrio zhugei]|uniref:Pleiotropic regulatory protein RsmS n=1 Tax=Vibrio zhugei TaxID=2479546 RepID=A0ABV7CEA1_9VIBR|nr:pleiotropic regulatory protein RsmS [Vibrio zhugei]